MDTNQFTQNELITRYNYSPATGIFTNRATGKTIGARHTAGYLVLRKTGACYYLHRLAFLYMTGDIPQHVDHIDHNRTNNQWANLREASHAINGRNHSSLTNNKTGLSGVYWCKPLNKWGVRMRCGNNEKVFLGYFNDFFEACCARLSHSIKNGFHPNHGRKV